MVNDLHSPSKLQVLIRTRPFDRGEPAYLADDLEIGQVSQVVVTPGVHSKVVTACIRLHKDIGIQKDMRANHEVGRLEIVLIQKLDETSGGLHVL